MFSLPLAFASPWVLTALITLPLIWLLLRLTPPKPQNEIFPPLVVLEKLVPKEETPAQSPWWLILLRLLMAALVIFAMAGPIWNPKKKILNHSGSILLVLDDGWASGPLWETIKETALNIVLEAEKTNRLITLVTTSDPQSASNNPQSADEVSAIIEASVNRSIRPDFTNLTEKIREIFNSSTFGEIIYLSDGLNRAPESGKLINQLEKFNQPINVLTPDITKLAILSDIQNRPAKMTGKVSRPLNTSMLPLRIKAYDKDGLVVAQSPVIIRDGKKTAEFEFSGPVELRNQIVRISIENNTHAGAVQLLDDSNRRRIVGLISGQSSDISQPLLSPLYYINRALAPFSDIRISDTSNLDKAADELIRQNVSAIIMTDIGTISAETNAKLEKFVSQGGLIIRFAGPRLAANPESTLLPVDLIKGDRFIGGALSWETPKKIAPFEPNSPFFGLSEPKNIVVSRQVLALQSRDLENRTWARLEDGTPLITAKQMGAGWIILFHVNADNNWSNLPLSGSFVEMLRRSINLSKSSIKANSQSTGLRLPALETLNGKGSLTPPSSSVKPLIVKNGVELATSLENPPGLYGTKDGYRALNLIRKDDVIASLDPLLNGKTITRHYYSGQTSFIFKPWLLFAASLLFLIDCLAVLWFAGVIKSMRPLKAFSNSLLVLTSALILTLIAPTSGKAQNISADGLNFSPALRTHFAYVKTGNARVDEISRAGLLGLTRFISARTALEPGEPLGVDISKDDLSFFPFLYWPIDEDNPTPDDATMARIDAYMKQGGSILFDTKDQINGLLNGTDNSGNFKLREILSSLDVPPLEPVPTDHVLTKSFYLLKNFPGRYQGGDLWVEQIRQNEEDGARPARAGDGVSTIMITSNDFAGAWAIDNNNRSLFATIPPDPRQREYAFRAGVNIVMYTMTGNYKADQVHIPALLERLGQ